MGNFESEPLFTIPAAERHAQRASPYEAVSVHELAALRSYELTRGLGYAALLNVHPLTQEITLSEDML